MAGFQGYLVIPESVASLHHIAQAIDYTRLKKHSLNLPVQLIFFNATIQPIFHTLFYFQVTD
ncbi:MAG: hypothetical protein OFPII_23850 [Osedax symbiont Rs1]|nr:MAG: hypothetical protein OFPII_23850 [Osedax symbiont Rs1]